MLIVLQNFIVLLWSIFPCSRKTLKKDPISNIPSAMISCFVWNDCDIQAFQERLKDSSIIKKVHESKPYCALA